MDLRQGDRNLDTKESHAYLETAQEQARDAELAFHESRYALTAFLSASTGETATAALLVTLGAKPSRKHRNSLILHRVLPSQPESIREDLQKLIESMKILEPHITKARYPIRKGIQLMPPSSFYNKQIAKETLEEAEQVLQIVKKILTR